jgi:hypothetical protein
MSWNADFSVQIFSQEHFMKTVVVLPGFVDPKAPNFRIKKKVFSLRYFSYKVLKENNGCMDLILVRLSIGWPPVNHVCEEVSLRGHEM